MNPEFLLRLQANQPLSSNLPSKADAQHFTDHMIAFLFPIWSNSHVTAPHLELMMQHLQLQLQELLLPLAARLSRPPATIVHLFFEKLPEVYEDLLQDARTIERFDPAAASLEEVIVAYPGFYAISAHRLSHVLTALDVPILPRIMSEHAHARTGIDIHPGAKIGHSFFIDHGTGVVIGESTTIGNNVKIYQGVTLGALNVRKDLANTKRHPTIEDNVIIYSGSTILGGETVIGHDSVIGGNVWLTESVEPFSVVYHKSEVHVRNERYTNAVEDFVI
jgi:serine O-acetyltransferase